MIRILADGTIQKIGYQTENNRTQVYFDLSDIMAEFPGGLATLLVQRPDEDDGAAYPVTAVEMEGSTLIWTVSAYDCEIRGRLKAQIMYTVDDVVAKTKIYKFYVDKSLINAEQAPSGWQDWVISLLEAATTTQAAINGYDEMTATATQLEPNEDPTASIDHSGDHPVLNLGIPKAYVANGEIDDTAGDGDTTKVWSADKLVEEFSEQSEEIENVKNAIVSGAAYDVLTDFNKPSATDAHVVYTWSGDVCHASTDGSAAGNSFINLLSSSASLPEKIIPGKKYFLKIKTSTTNLRFGIIPYKNGSSMGGKYFTSDTEYTFPADATGVILRINTVSGSTLSNATIEAHMLMEESNKGIGNALNTLKKKELFNVSEWVNGGYNYSNGSISSSSPRIYTPNYINDFVSEIYSDDADGRFLLYAWDQADTYVGAWLNNAFSTSDVSDLVTVNFNKFRASYPNYKFKLTYKKTSGDVTISTVGTNIHERNIIYIYDENPVRLKIIGYNIGKFNYGNTGGLSSNVAEKIANYKQFFADQQADAVCMVEFPTNIDSGGTYPAKETIFSDVFMNFGTVTAETAIATNCNASGTQFSWLHVTGEPQSRAAWVECKIDSKVVAIVTGALMVDATQAQKESHLAKLFTKLSGYDYVIMYLDTNVASAEEASALKTVFNTAGYKTGNWGYFGYKNTYNLSSQDYKCIDNIFVKGNIKLTSFDVPNVYADLSSDHFPVVSEVVIY